MDWLQVESLKMKEMQTRVLANLCQKSSDLLGQISASSHAPKTFSLSAVQPVLIFDIWLASFSRGLSVAPGPVR